MGTTDQKPGGGVSRRRFLKTAAGAGASVAVTAVTGGLGAAILAPRPAAAVDAPPDPVTSQAPRIIPFEGEHQAGIDRPAVTQGACLLAAFHVVSPSRDDLRLAFQDLTRRARMLASADNPPPGDPLLPPEESGILGPAIGPANTTITFGVGASLFDDRFGLADRKPRQLVEMPWFPNDQLDPARSHGDLLIKIASVDADACIHALRHLQLGTRSSLALRWVQEGFLRPDVLPAGQTSTRNLLGFKDGTANLPPGSPTLDEMVWVQPDDGEPDWAVGGTYLVVRTIRMFVEFWDRTALDEQQKIMGRTKRTGAPLGMDREEDIPDYAGAQRDSIPVDAHIRLANPRTQGTLANRIFRQGWNYSRGFDPAGQLDQGLLFLAFQRDLGAGFMAVQARLNGEPLEEYIRPEGGGFFYVLPGITSSDESIGTSLLA
jgi:deferrochelatase/peroxidase EfeB